MLPDFFYQRGTPNIESEQERTRPEQREHIRIVRCEQPTPNERTHPERDRRIDEHPLTISIDLERDRHARRFNPLAG